MLLFTNEFIHFLHKTDPTPFVSCGVTSRKRPGPDATYFPPGIMQELVAKSDFG